MVSMERTTGTIPYIPDGMRTGRTFPGDPGEDSIITGCELIGEPHRKGILDPFTGYRLDTIYGDWGTRNGKIGGFTVIS